jgi:hypothetical protein
VIGKESKLLDSLYDNLGMLIVVRLSCNHQLMAMIDDKTSVGQTSINQTSLDQISLVQTSLVETSSA